MGGVVVAGIVAATRARGTAGKGQGVVEGIGGIGRGDGDEDDVALDDRRRDGVLAGVDFGHGVGGVEDQSGAVGRIDGPGVGRVGGGLKAVPVVVSGALDRRVGRAALEDRGGVGRIVVAGVVAAAAGRAAGHEKMVSPRGVVAVFVDRDEVGRALGQRLFDRGVGSLPAVVVGVEVVPAVVVDRDEGVDVAGGVEIEGRRRRGNEAIEVDIAETVDPGEGRAALGPEVRRVGGVVVAGVVAAAAFSCEIGQLEAVVSGVPGIEALDPDEEVFSGGKFDLA